MVSTRPSDDCAGGDVRDVAVNGRTERWVPDVVPDNFPSNNLRIAILAGVRFATTEPHAGGLERHTDTLARELSRAGHRVTVFAGSRNELTEERLPYSIEPLVATRYEASNAARSDVSMPPDRFMIEHDAYLDVLSRLEGFDVVHNNSLNYLPVITPSSVPVVHTLHTPPTPWLESGYRIRDDRRSMSPAFDNSRVVSVSHANARQWRHHVDLVVHNGVELSRWRVGSGRGGYGVWSGRIVPEKGLHLALDAAERAGLELRVAGPIHDRGYFDEMVAPRLDRAVGAEYLGHLNIEELARLTADAAVAVITPCWEEPFGLVAAEALACGTPVAAFHCGALGEIVSPDVGSLAPSGNVDALANAVSDAISASRLACRRRAVERFSADVMALAYIHVYRSLTDPIRRTMAVSA